MFVSAFLIHNSIFCQTRQVQLIRDHYYKIQNMVQSCNDNTTDICNLYSDEILLNSKGGLWRGIGNFQKKYIFWYEDDPNNCGECPSEGASTLQLVNIEALNDVYKTKSEFLYKENRLIFSYEKDEYEGIEYRYYIADGVLIRYMENEKILDVAEVNYKRFEKVKNTANQLQQLFIMSHK